MLKTFLDSNEMAFNFAKKFPNKIERKILIETYLEIVSCNVIRAQKILSIGFISTIHYMLIEIAFQSEEGFANHAWIICIVFYTFDQDPKTRRLIISGSIYSTWMLRVVKLGDFPEIHENQILVVTHNPWNFSIGIFNRVHIIDDHIIQVFSKLFFSFHQFTYHSPEIYYKNFPWKFRNQFIVFLK